MQFFMTTDELEMFLGSLLEEEGVDAALVLQNPFSIKKLSSFKVARDLHFCHVVFMNSGEVPIDAKSFFEVQDRLPDSLSFVLTFTPGSLREQILSGTPRQGALKSFAMKTRRTLRRMTKSGMSVKIEGNPVVGYAKNARFSAGAKSSFSSGTPLVGLSEKHLFIPETVLD